MLAKPESFSPPDEVCCWPGRRVGEAGRGAVAEKLAGAPWLRGWPGRRGETVAGRDAVAERLAGALMRMAGAHRCVMAVRALAQKHREEASGKRVQDWQPRARLARKYTMGEALHDGQAPPRQGNRVHGWQRDARWKRRCSAGKRMPGYFCLGGALRGYILSITSMGTPRIRCSCLFVAE